MAAGFNSLKGLGNSFLRLTPYKSGEVNLPSSKKYTVDEEFSFKELNQTLIKIESDPQNNP